MTEQKVFDPSGLSPNEEHWVTHFQHDSRLAANGAVMLEGDDLKLMNWSSAILWSCLDLSSIDADGNPLNPHEYRHALLREQTPDSHNLPRPAKLALVGLEIRNLVHYQGLDCSQDQYVQEVPELLGVQPQDLVAVTRYLIHTEALVPYGNLDLVDWAIDIFPESFDRSEYVKRIKSDPDLFSILQRAIGSNIYYDNPDHVAQIQERYEIDDEAVQDIAWGKIFADMSQLHADRILHAPPTATITDVLSAKYLRYFPDITNIIRRAEKAKQQSDSEEFNVLLNAIIRLAERETKETL